MDDFSNRFEELLRNTIWYMPYTNGDEAVRKYVVELCIDKLLDDIELPAQEYDSIKSVKRGAVNFLKRKRRKVVK